MSNDRLKSKTSKGLLWSLVERFSTQGIQFVFSIIIARILSPSDYGVIAMPLIFLSIAQCFIDSGFSTALVRKDEIKEDNLSMVNNLKGDKLPVSAFINNKDFIFLGSVEYI